MRTIASLSLLVPVAMAATLPIAAQPSDAAPSYWLAGELGFGSVHLSSSQGSKNRNALAMAVEGGMTLNPYLGLGLRLNGWTIQASNLNDPSKGESLSQALVFLRVHPAEGSRFFIRVGAGYASYTNHHPQAFSGRGWGYSVGLGYEHPLTRRIRLVPAVNFNGGSLGNVDNSIASIRDRRYDVIDLSLGLRFP